MSYRVKTLDVRALLEPVVDPLVDVTSYHDTVNKWFLSIQHMGLGLPARQNLVHEIQQQANETVDLVHRMTQKDSAEREFCKKKHEDFLTQFQQNLHWMLSIRFSLH